MNFAVLVATSECKIEDLIMTPDDFHFENMDHFHVRKLNVDPQGHLAVK